MTYRHAAFLPPYSYQTDDKGKPAARRGRKATGLTYRQPGHRNGRMEKMRASDLLARVGIVGSLMLSMLALSAGASAQAHKKPRPSREDRSLATDRIGAWLPTG